MTALHQTIRNDIEAKIRSGAWPPGHKIPIEQEIMARYGCARMTASKALSALAEGGLIVRRKRAGSFVAHPRIHAMVVEIPDIEHEIMARGQRYAFDLVRREVRASRLDGDSDMAPGPSGRVLELRGVHIANGRPFALEDRIISLSAVPDAEAIDFAGVSPGAWLLQHVPWTEAENRISAVAADATDAEVLTVPNGSPCLAVDRRTWRGDEGITRVRQLFPGEAYDLVARFGPQGQASAASGRVARPLVEQEQQRP